MVVIAGRIRMTLEMMVMLLLLLLLLLSLMVCIWEKRKGVVVHAWNQMISLKTKWTDTREAKGLIRRIFDVCMWAVQLFLLHQLHWGVSFSSYIILFANAPFFFATKQPFHGSKRQPTNRALSGTENNH